ncbi:tryptophan dimethylallyltransferase family protein [Saccharopolyspora flava]|uniref:tryptophan dimethylallyltransferase family protein n=1 Tax=Saccharopolyspora flava TaxID=95161 RepID=UPI001FEA4838|nr:tryptophan dimethylallyltransferase family protein [Saccharopolyspora flava]
MFPAYDVSFVQFLTSQYRTVARHLGFPRSDVETLITELSVALQPWGDHPIGSCPEVPSFVSADGFPAEMSLSWREHRPELRVLFESLGDDPTPAGCQRAGRALTERLAGVPGVDLHRYRLVEDLFLSDDPRLNRPTIWHSLAWRPGESTRYKAYFNPQVDSTDPADVLDRTTEAMQRLGLGSSWSSVRMWMPEMIDRGNEIEFAALDLSNSTDARVKVYFRINGRSLEDLDAVASLASGHDSERAARVWRSLYHGQDKAEGEEPMVCLAFRSGSPQPDEANLYLRLPGNAESDEDAAARTAELMRAEGLDPASYLDMIEALAPRPPSTMTGLQDLLAYRTKAPDRPADIGMYLRFSVYDRPVEP